MVEKINEENLRNVLKNININEQNIDLECESKNIQDDFNCIYNNNSLTKSNSKISRISYDKDKELILKAKNSENEYLKVEDLDLMLKFEEIEKKFTDIEEIFTCI